MGHVMIRFAVLAVLAFSIAVLAAIASTPPVGSNWTETIKSVGVGVAAAAGIVTPILTIMMARYQQALTSELERLKASYTQDIEILKNSLSENLEIRKVEIAGQVRAFDAMLNAAHFFYFVLREEANHNLSASDALFAEADKKAAEASASLWHLPDDDRQIWQQVYQRSKHLADLIKHSSSPDKSDQLRRYAAELGEFIDKLQNAGQKVFAEARALNIDEARPNVQNRGASSSQLH